MRRGATAAARLGLLLAASALPAAQAASPRVVAELFTSLGCSSCPPADAMAVRLGNDPDVLVLSFHVTYWDDLGWKDPFSSAAATERQYGYARSLQQRSVFTPQLVIDGVQSLVGSAGVVPGAVARAAAAGLAVHAALQARADGALEVSLEGPPMGAEVWEIRYVRHASTRVPGGENTGRTLETRNDVTSVRNLGRFAPGKLTLPPLKTPDDGIAVLVQEPDQGRIVGAAAN